MICMNIYGNAHNDVGLDLASENSCVDLISKRAQRMYTITLLYRQSVSFSFVSLNHDTEPLNHDTYFRHIDNFLPIQKKPLWDSLQWRYNGCDSGFLNRLFRHRSKKTSKLRVTGLCAGNSPEAGEFHAQMASNAENASIWWRHHVHHRSQMACYAFRLTDPLSPVFHQSTNVNPILSILSRYSAIQHPYQIWLIIKSLLDDSGMDTTSWASYQIRKIAGCACDGNAGKVFPATDFKWNR